MTIWSLPGYYRVLPADCPVIEEIVEGFVEGILDTKSLI
jgi:hypothetical protein